jgi:molybdate transport system permease protein
MYQLVESMNFAQAHLIAGSLVAFSFVALLLLLLVERRIGNLAP